MRPGTAVKELDPTTGEKVIIEVDESVCRMAEYTYNIRWVNGYSMAEFDVDSTKYMQPVKEDVRVKEKGRRRRREAAPRREAPGVAPEAAGEPVRRPRRGRERHNDPL